MIMGVHARGSVKTNAPASLSLSTRVTADIATVPSASPLPTSTPRSSSIKCDYLKHIPNPKRPNETIIANVIVAFNGIFSYIPFICPLFLCDVV
jgi:hypothetical protein